METLQNLVESYLESAGFNLIDTREGFIVADKLGFGGDRDTQLVWVTPPPRHVDNFDQLEKKLLREFETIIPQYPNAKYSLVADTLGGFSREFRFELGRFRVRMKVAIQFFDAPFRIEESPEAASAISTLKYIPSTRVPQPYSILIEGEPQEQGEDLLSDLLDELTRRPKSPRLHVVVGTAGAGKSVFFQALFYHAYEHFQKQKQRQEIAPRPIPLIPEYLRGATALRVQQLVDSFLRTDVAAPVATSTFEWMLQNGFSKWLFDGLDELYTGDPDFFWYLLDLLTRSETRAQILICARESLLTTSETFASFFNDFTSGPKEVIRVYRLNDWEYPSKRALAWVRFEGRIPNKGQTDSQEISRFLTAISNSEALKTLSGLPYYCDLLLEEFKQGTLKEYADDFDLLEHAVAGIIKREIRKGLLSQGQFEPEGLDNWLETVAVELYDEEFKGLDKTAIEEYAHLVLREDLSEDEYDNAITTLIRFPLFTSGTKPGVVTFKHELIGEYLAARYLIKSIIKDPVVGVRGLASRIDFADSLIARYIANRLAGIKGGTKTIIDALRNEALNDRGFVILLQLLLLSIPGKDFIKTNKIELESRDLRYVRFNNSDLQEVSFRNCNLTNTTFKGCELQNALFEGSYLSGTRFERLSEGALKGARFGDLGRFEFIYVEKKRIDNLKDAIEWVQRTTGQTDKIKEPCPAALQLRALFLKFVNPDGNGRRSELPLEALIKGKRFPGAPSPEDVVKACRRFGYLEGPDQRKRIKRISGDQYTDLVDYIRDWKVTTEIRQLLNAICPAMDCEHVPGSR